MPESYAHLDSPTDTHGGIDIVALDDDADFREYVTAVLEGEGPLIRAVSTPNELYDTAERRLPDVVLLDMNMGRDSGAQVLEEIRKR